MLNRKTDKLKACIDKIPSAEEARGGLDVAEGKEILHQLQDVSKKIQNAIATKQFPIYYDKALCDVVKEILTGKGYKITHEKNYCDDSSYYVIDVEEDNEKEEDKDNHIASFTDI